MGDRLDYYPDSLSGVHMEDGRLAKDTALRA